MNAYFAQTLTNVLEETSTNMGNAMTLDHLSKHGTVTIEEASFYHNLCEDVITESAEDFIPDTVEVPDAPVVPEPTAPIELFDAVGNKYSFADGQLTPIEDEVAPEAEMGEGEPAPEVAPEQAPEVAPEVEVAPEQAPVVEEGTVVAEPVIEEGTVVAEPEVEILEENDNVVARILANLKS
jgi:hypothetical protein